MNLVRVYNPEFVSSEASLMVAFETVVIPAMRRNARSESTINEVRRGVRAWCEYHGKTALNTRIQYPRVQGLADIGRKDILAFRDWLITDRRFPNVRANKYVAAVQRCLKVLEYEESPRFEVSSPPSIRRLDEQSRETKFYLRFLDSEQQKRLDELLALGSAITVDQSEELAQLRHADELSRIYRAASVAVWPLVSRSGQEIDPVAQWQAAIVMWATYGLRTQDQAAYDRQSELTWSRVSWQRETPQVGYHAQSEWGWFSVVMQKTKRLIVLPLSQIASAHLRAIQTPLFQGQEPVFNWPRCNRNFYRQWYAIVEAAKFPAKFDLANGHQIKLQIKHLRKTAATWHDHYEPGLGSIILGHTCGKNITDKHYRNPELRLVAAMGALPVPESWRWLLDRSNHKQKLLFR